MLNRRNGFAPVPNPHEEVERLENETEYGRSPLPDSEEHNSESKQTTWSCTLIISILQGKLMILLSGTLTVIVLSIVKHFAHLPVGQFTATLFTLVWLFNSSVYFFCEKHYDYKGKAKFILSRSAFGALGGLLKLWAARVLPVGDSIAIFSCMPVFAAFFSRVLWKEKINIFTIIALLLGLTGVCFIAKPPFLFGGDKDEGNALYPLIPLFAALSNGFAFSCMRKVGTGVSPLLVTSNVAVFIVVDGLIFNFVIKDEFVLPDCYADRIAITLGALAYMLALYLINKGLALEKSGPGTLMKNCDVVTAYIIQIAFFNSIPDIFSVIGAFMVLSSAVLVSASKLVFEKMCKMREF